MVVESSLTGLFRMLLIIVGAILLFRFIAQFMNAKRDMEAERVMNEERRKFNEEKERVAKTVGKTRIIKDKSTLNSDIEDVDFDEIN